MKEKWMVSAKRADFNAISRKFGIDPVIARIIRNRDHVTEEEIDSYLNGTLEDIPSESLLKDCDFAADIILEKIRLHKTLRIIGDYDIDGVTATYILMEGLRKLGADVDTYIPDRVTDGYGLHMPLIEKAAQDGIDTVITCDNGIAAAAEIGYAKSLGLTVIVTDHHEVPFTGAEEERKEILPPADAVIDPKQKECPYPNKNICGAVVAGKLIRCIYRKLNRMDELPGDLPEIEAIATVGDVMTLVGENRILVKYGLKKLPGTANIGLAALIRACGLEGKRLSAYHIGFVIGPCINASGRLETAALSLALLEEKNKEKAEETAGKLQKLNEARKAFTEEGLKAAEEAIESSPLKEDRVLVVHLPDVHESIAGIIAGRLREKYYRPALVLTGKGETIKGSGRSTEAYSMFEKLSACKDLMQQFGGHPMAAGLTMAADHLEELRRRLNEDCGLAPEDLIPRIVIDVPMPLGYITRELVEELSLLEPFGNGNSKPLFAVKDVRISGPRMLGNYRRVVKMTVYGQDGGQMEALYFGDADAFMEALLLRENHLSIIYYPEINSYRGTEKLQIIIQNYC